ncbi:cation:proton antiporter domain-containing protein [Baaleninema simplex]|uniref:cation:proton antiporter domain-containing protein n=1 Tax=Baaleninema simplex TaxID=2862350 RepID=UPI00034C8AFA|nr:cation:proton antiporter [Baaleninema simplex]
MLASALWILAMGFFGGQIARRLGLPPLVGTIIIGILVGPQIGNVLSPQVLASADDLRTVAVTIVLMKAGLGLDRDKLARQGSVALRLGFLPAAAEALVVAVAATLLFGFDVPTGLILGCIIGAESPAVIVPGMLRLKSLGWGVEKGIPDAILTGSALSDVLLLLVFSLLLGFLEQQTQTGLTLGAISLSPVQLLPLQVLLKIVLGVFFGYLAARLLVSLLVKQNWTQTAVQDVAIAACLALFLTIADKAVPVYSGYLAVMSMGFFLIELDTPLARRLRGGFDALWTIAEIVLFVLLGATLQLEVLEAVLLPGLLLLAVGLLVGRSIGWWLSTLGSDWNRKERLFLLPGNMAKATVQAAIGAIPLARGIEGGDVILALAALSILVTAPVGAWATQTFAPTLLERGTVDPTKVATIGRPVFLAAIDTSEMAPRVLAKAADLARRSDGEVLVLHVSDRPEEEDLHYLRSQIRRLLADIRHDFLVLPGVIPETITTVARSRRVTDIVIAKQGHHAWETVLVGSVSQTVLETSAVPVVLVNGETD